MECEFCKQILSTKYILKNHQKRVKSCLKLQGKIPDDMFKCKFCNEVFTANSTLKTHIKNCKKSELYTYQKQIEELNNHNQELKEEHKKQLDEMKEFYEKQIDKLQDKLENIALKASMKHTTNNTINFKTYMKENFTPITYEVIENSKDKLKAHHILKKGEGMAQHALEFIKESKMMVCTDRSRSNFWYLWIQRILKEDPELVNFRKEYFSRVSPSAKNVIDKYFDTNPQIKHNWDDYSEIMDTYSDIINEALGNNSRLTADFIKAMANNTKLGRDMQVDLLSECETEYEFDT